MIEQLRSMLLDIQAKLSSKSEDKEIQALVDGLLDNLEYIRQKYTIE